VDVNISIHNCCEWMQGRSQQLLRAHTHHNTTPTSHLGAAHGLQWLWPLFCTSVLITAALLLWDLLTGSQTRPFYLERCPKASSGGHPNPTLSISSSLHPNDLQSQSLPPWRPLALSLLNFSPWHLLSLASNVLLSYFVYLICPPEM